MRIAGVGAAYGPLRAAYRAYRRDSSEAPPRLDFDRKGHREALAALAGGAVEAAVMRGGSFDERAAAISGKLGVRVSAHRLSKAPLVILVHKLNRVPSMTVSEVEAAFRGEVDSWSGLGWVNRPIERVGTVYPALSWGIFTRRVLDGRPIRDGDGRGIGDPKAGAGGEVPGGGAFPRYARDAKVVREVSRNLNAIGYCLLESGGELAESVRAVPIAARDESEPVAPEKEDILADDYPLQETFWLLVRSDASEAAHGFIDFVRSVKGAEKIASTGHHGVNRRGAAVAARKLRALRSGAAPKITATGTSGLHGLAGDLAMAYTKRVAPLGMGYDRPLRARAFVAGECELMLLGEPLVEVVAAEHRRRIREAAGRRLTIGGRAVALIVNSNNPIERLSRGQVRQVFSGEATSWDQLGGESAPLRVLGQTGRQAATKVFYATAIDAEKRRNMTYKAADREVIREVLFDKRAIGYVDLGAISEEHLPADERQAGLRLLAIGGEGEAIAPSAETVRTGRYPYAKRLTLLVHRDASREAKAFAEFLVTEELGEVFNAHGFVQTPKSTTAANRQADRP